MIVHNNDNNNDNHNNDPNTIVLKFNTIVNNVYSQENFRINLTSLTSTGTGNRLLQYYNTVT